MPDEPPRDAATEEAEGAAWEEWQAEKRARGIAWLVERYDMSSEGAARFIDDLTQPDGVDRLLDQLEAWPAHLSFGVIDPRVQGRQLQSEALHKRVLAVLPEAERRATEDAKRHGRAKPTASAVNSWAAKLAECSIRLVQKVRAEQRNARLSRAG
jgi:hypothetical protein